MDNQDRFNFECVKKFGNRTSSFITLYPEFSDIKLKNGHARGVVKKNKLIMASEPQCKEELRAEELQRLAKERSVCIFPVSKKLSDHLLEKKFTTFQIGSEPIFLLQEYFKTEPLEFLPLARSLKKRGAEVISVLPEEIEIYGKELQRLFKEWKDKKKISLSFLNQVDPFFKSEHKRFFILKLRNKITAFMSAVPFFYGGEILGYYLNDIIRAKTARSGSSELLIIEGMRILKEEGFLEVRLGMAPLANIKSQDFKSMIMRIVFNNFHTGYNFLGLYNFKNKLNPSRWDDLYLASSEKSILKNLKSIFDAHFPKGFLFLMQFLIALKAKDQLRFRPEVKKYLQINSGQELYIKTLKEFFLATKWTHCFVFSFITLHLLKVSTDFALTLFGLSAYVPGNVTPLGLIFSPFFHNDYFHLFGDQLSFYISGVMLERILGAKRFLILVAVGLFLSNPVTHAICYPVLKFFPNLYENNFLAERDVGSSNAIFTLIGALGILFVKNNWLFVPFILYAVFIAFSLQSFLAIHHLTAIFMGYVLMRYWIYSSR